MLAHAFSSCNVLGVGRKEMVKSSRGFQRASEDISVVLQPIIALVRARSLRM